MPLPQAVLLICAAVSAGLTIRARLNDTPRQEYIFKPLTMVFIIAVALLADDPVSQTYQVLLVFALLASLAGDVFLMLPSDKFIQGLISFLLAHLLYIAAFTIEGTGRAPLWYIIPFVLYGGVMLRLLWAHLGDLRGPVLVYMTVILLMGWQAVNRMLETDQAGTSLALVGAYFFIASDSALALERFRGSWRSAPVWILGFYFAAQALFALSI